VPVTAGRRLLSWASVIDDATLEQARRTASMPFVHPHVALMPDAHLGKGSTVGSVIPTERALMPAAVGVDIGCGMIAARTSLTGEDLRTRGELRELRVGIERDVPLSAGQANRELTETAAARVSELEDRAEVDYDRFASRWRLQLGTLGSGNHFIEVSLDEADRVWVFLHSGSRGVGNRIAQRHTATAQELCRRWYVDLPHPDLAYLVEGTDEFWAYVRDLRWAQRYALLNREEMLDRVLARLARWWDGEVVEHERISCHHNYTEQEEHAGREVWVSRKGAIEAREGTPGLIPGSMGTASYVVVGKGEPASLFSAPHGAGRTHSRTGHGGRSPSPTCGRR
jgi:tRNA-splicing ligase RtcB